MTRAAIYARYSSDRQREASLEDQVRICRERADREGSTVTTSFGDRAISGASLLRAGLQGLVAEAMAGRIDVVITEALDRLSRDQADVATIYKQLTFAGVRIITLAEGEISELHVGLKGTMNQLFLKDLAEKTRRGLRGRVEAGRSGGGNSFGCDVVRRLGSDGEPVTGSGRPTVARPRSSAGCSRSLPTGARQSPSRSASTRRALPGHGACSGGTRRSVGTASAAPAS